MSGYYIFARYVHESVKRKRERDVYAITGQAITPAKFKRLSDRERATLKMFYDYKNGYLPMPVSHSCNYSYMKFLEYLLFWVKAGNGYFSILCSDETYRIVQATKKQPRAIDLLRTCKLFYRHPAG